MAKIARTHTPPYYAVIFTSIRTEGDQGYSEMAKKMEALAKQQDGFLGIESCREELGITVSFWSSLSAIQQWKQHVEHLEAQRLGREKWYADFMVRIAKVEREYSFQKT